MERRFRVMQVLPRLGDGGVERSAADMARYLSGRGIDNWVAAADGRLGDEIRATGSRVIDLPVGAKAPWSMLANARRLATVIDADGIDIVHALSRAPAWVAYLACRWFVRRKCHFIATVHGAHGHGNAVKRFYNSGMLRGPLVIASSAFIAEHLNRVYGVTPDRIVLATRGIDPAIFDPARFTSDDRRILRQSLGVADDRPVLMMVGRITELKGHAVLIDALARIADRPWHMVFVGSGKTEMEAGLRRQVAARGLSERVVWAGSRSDVAALLNAADLAFSASIRPEAFGLTTIEASAMATAVIGTDHGGSRETIVPGVTGWLVEPGNAVALAEAIAVALNDRTRCERMAQAGRDHVLRHFTKTRMLEAEFSAYERLLAGEG